MTGQDAFEARLERLLLELSAWLPRPRGRRWSPPPWRINSAGGEA